MNVDISPEDINKYVADKILNSALGEALRKVIDDEIKKLSQSYDNPLQKAVQQEIQRLIMAVVETEYGPKLRAAIQERMTDKIVGEVANKAFDAWMNGR